MKDGNARYVAGNLSVRDHLRQLDMTATGQYALAVVLTCMDSRVHAEKIFDLGLGDMFSVRIAGNFRETRHRVECPPVPAQCQEREHKTQRNDR